MITCLNIQAFSLRAALRSRPELMRGPVALASPPGSRPLLGACSAAAEEAGVRPGMRPRLATGAPQRPQNLWPFATPVMHDRQM